MINFGPNDPVRLMLQSILDKIQKLADSEGLSIEKYIQKELDKQE